MSDNMRFICNPAESEDAAVVSVAADGLAATRSRSKPLTDTLHRTAVLYLDRDISAGSTIRIKVTWSPPSPRNTVTIGIGCVSCDPVQIQNRGLSHLSRCCPTGNCLSAGRSFISLIGISATDRKQSLLSISRRSDNELSVRLDGHSFDVIRSSDSRISFATETPVLILTQDVYSVQLIAPAAIPVLGPKTKRTPADLIDVSNSADKVMEKPSYSSKVMLMEISKSNVTGNPVAAIASNGASGSKGRLRFVVPNDVATVLTTAPDKTTIHRKSIHVNREQMIAHLNKQLEIGGKMVFMIEKITNSQKWSHSLQLGFTLCDLTSTEKIASHRKSCGDTKICRKTCSQVLSSVQSAGSVVTVTRSENKISISTEWQFESKVVTFKFPDLKVGGHCFSDLSINLFPFVVMNGSAESLRILHDSISQTESQRGSERPMSLSPEPSNSKFKLPFQKTRHPVLSVDPQGKAHTSAETSNRPELTEQMEFLSTPYNSQSIRILQKGLKVECKSLSAPLIVYLNRPMAVGEDLVLRTLSSDGMPVRNYSYLFGVTTCSKQSVLSSKHHMLHMCSLTAACKQLSQTSEMWNFSRPGDKARIELGATALRISHFGPRPLKPYIKWLGAQITGQDLLPFIVLDAAVKAVEIVPDNDNGSIQSDSRLGPFPLQKSSSLSDDGFKDMDEEFPNALAIEVPADPSERLRREVTADTTITDNSVRRLVSPVLWEQTRFATSELSIQEEWDKVTNMAEVLIPTKEQESKTAPLAFESGEAFLSTLGPISGLFSGSTLSDLSFLNLLYEHDGIEFLNGNQKIRRIRENGSMHVFFNRSIELDESFTLIGTNDNRKRESRFQFGFTSCDLSSIVSRKEHLQSPCNPAICGATAVKCMNVMYSSSEASGVTISRNFDHIAFDVGNGPGKKRFLKRFPSGHTFPQYQWSLFVCLTGDVSGLEITNFSSGKSTSGKIDSMPRLRLSSLSETSDDGNSIFGSICRHGDDSPSRISSNTVLTAPIPSLASIGAAGDSNGHNPQAMASDTMRGRNFVHIEVKKTALPVERPFRQLALLQNTVRAPQPHTSGVMSGSVALTAQKSGAKRKWFSNSMVSFQENVIRRFDVTGEAGGYIFSSKFQVGDQITFTALLDDNSGDQSSKLAFGVTTRSLLTLDVSSLPEDASLLSRHEYTGEFSVFPRLMSCVGICDGLTLRRTQSGIALILDDNDTEIISLDSNLTVYPFFQLSGCAVQITPD